MVGGTELVEQKFFQHDYESSSSDNSSSEEVKQPLMKQVMSGVTEKYYIEDDEWDLLKPVLNKPKAGAALCKF